MKIRDLMTTDVTTVNPNTPINEIALQMKSLDIGSIPVCEQGNKAVGIVTDRDIVIRSLSQGKMQANAQDVMTSALIFATPDMNAHEAAEMMAKHQIRRLPVVENGKLVGIVSIGDLATVNMYTNEAGDALSDISKPTKRQI